MTRSGNDPFGDDHEPETHISSRSPRQLDLVVHFFADRPLTDLPYRDGVERIASPGRDTVRT